MFTPEVAAPAIQDRFCRRFVCSPAAEFLYSFKPTRAHCSGAKVVDEAVHAAWQTRLRHTTGKRLLESSVLLARNALHLICVTEVPPQQGR